jgi:twitching motility protein PilJ
MAINFANIKSLPAKLVADIKGLFTRQADQSGLSAGETPRGLLGLLLLCFAVALIGLLLNLMQVNRDQHFSQAAGDVQVHVQQAARDAALAVHGDQTAAGRLANIMGSMDSNIKTMRKLEAETIIRGSEVSPLLDQIESKWASLHDDISKINVVAVSDRPAEAVEKSTANLSGIVAASDEILATAHVAVTKYQAQGKAGLWLLISVVAGFIALILLVLIGYRQVTNARQQFIEIEKANLSNQEAILNLLDEMGDLADGDLTVKAKVSENITGAIADSINYTIDSLRDLVTEINRATEQVNNATAQAQGTSASLLTAAEQQSKQIVETGEAVTIMTRSILQVSSNAGQASQVAQRSLQAATQGTKAVQNTISGMNEIRTQIQETSKRIKRLGESSQEISEIVELISDITEQTNILALNAAIQAASAGEAGRGFTVVAEEVQRLAERSSEATKQISAIVKTIQTDTNGAVAAMEKSTEGVVEGARLSDAAGQALNEIETVTNNLAQLIQAISTATAAQTEVASTVSRNMQQIQNITSQTTEGTKETAQSVGQLSALAGDLRSSVAGFKLS